MKLDISAIRARLEAAIKNPYGQEDYGNWDNRLVLELHHKEYIKALLDEVERLQKQSQEHYNDWQDCRGCMSMLEAKLAVAVSASKRLDEIKAVIYKCESTDKDWLLEVLNGAMFMALNEIDKL